MLEVELKFRAGGPDALQRLRVAPTLGPAMLGAPDTYDELDRYLDTADLRLAARRWACRLRTRRGDTIVSLKGPAEPTAGGDAALHRRPELEGPATDRPDAADWPPSTARDRLLDLSDGKPLLERLSLAQRRTERDVLVDGASIGTLSLDHVQVWRDGRQRGELWCVELEQHADDGDADLHELAHALNGADGLVPDPLTKLEHALGLAPEAAAT
ncbi:MAG TPA: CYTH domain-containing protein [Candidatus Limnocylindria bacterium]|nr:CYTH domain-containing protein [Candidatus Limnocylindria bacterium]